MRVPILHNYAFSLHPQSNSNSTTMFLSFSFFSVPSHSCLSLVSNTFLELFHSKRFFTSNAYKKFIRVLFFFPKTLLFLTLLILSNPLKLLSFSTLWFLTKNTLVGTSFNLRYLSYGFQSATSSFSCFRNFLFWVVVLETILGIICFSVYVCLDFQRERHYSVKKGNILYL